MKDDAVAFSAIRLCFSWHLFLCWHIFVFYLFFSNVNSSKTWLHVSIKGEYLERVLVCWCQITPYSWGNLIIEVVSWRLKTAGEPSKYPPILCGRCHSQTHCVLFQSSACPCSVFFWVQQSQLCVYSRQRTPSRRTGKQFSGFFFLNIWPNYRSKYWSELVSSGFRAHLEHLLGNK